MKETTKKKLRKVAKGVGFGVLGFFATIGIVATIASLSMCGSDGKSEANPTRVALRQRREAPRFDQEDNVFGGNDYRALEGWTFNVTEGKYVFWRTDRRLWYGRIPSAGLYYVRFIDYDASNTVLVLNDTQKETLLSNAYYETQTYFPSNEIGHHAMDGDGLYWYFTESEVSAGSWIWSRNGVEVFACDLMDANPSDYVSLPDNWKPYNLVDLAPNANGFGTASKRSGASLSPLGYGLIDGLLFRSNGSLYNRVEVLPWTPFNGGSSTEAHTFGYYDSTGSLKYKAMHLDPDDGLILLQIRYSFVLSDLPRALGSVAMRTDVVAECPELDGVQIEGETRTIYLSGGALAWNSPLFRELEVLDVYKTDVRPTDALMARSPLEWLRLSLASVSPTPSGDGVTIGDGMTLVSDGLTAVMPVLGVEILPSVSLGLLLFLPLIGGIIVLIVKVFSK